MMFAQVLFPLRLRGALTYFVPESMVGEIVAGSWVHARVVGRQYLCVVVSVTEQVPEIELSRIREIDSLVPLPKVSLRELDFWKRVADYYMCTVGEVFKAAYSFPLQRQIEKVPKRKLRSVDETGEITPLPELSKAQKTAFNSIRSCFSKKRMVLLEGVTGSGKTEIYMHLASVLLEEGKSVLYLVPEIAVSRQLKARLERHFGDKLLVYHSKRTMAGKKMIFDKLKSDGAYMVLGTRSSVFLPFNDLGLVIVDEEHDSSYKQTEPAPRYSGRDAAMLLASQCGAFLVMGSATPSFESRYNVETGKIDKVSLDSKFYEAEEPQVELIDMRQVRRLRNYKGPFSIKMLNAVRETVEKGEQVMVFRSRRSYSPFVQCSECGTIVKCPHCNVSLSYHKYNNMLMCHCCGYKVDFTTRCPQCGEPSLLDRGAGTEKVEEELKECFPSFRIARFDADTTGSAVEEQKILKDFAAGKIDILVGTQMITKGFDFEKLSLVAVVATDSLFAVQDFRADERASQLLQQLRGRAGRRGVRGRMLIQTEQPEHPVLLSLSGGNARSASLEERRTFNFPPYVRLVTVTVKDRYEGELWRVSQALKRIFGDCGVADVTGPFVPPLDKIDDYHLTKFWLKLPRSRRTSEIKKALFEKTELLKGDFKNRPIIVIDVDPQ